MAILWPRKVPQSVRENPLRSAEIRVYNALAEALDDGFHVFYSSPWIGLDRYGYEIDGECDFYVAHPQYGILAIEVKGGEISFDPAQNQWRSTDRDGIRHRIKDPVHQAKSAKYSLLKRLNDFEDWPTRRIQAAHGVIFPNVATPPSDLGADRPSHIFCCSRQLTTGFREWIFGRLREPEGQSHRFPLGLDGIQALERLLAHPFTLRTNIGTALDDATSEFQVLEVDQFQILESIREIPRVLLKGAAGTGKTVVAVEEARISARSGKNTLLTCYNRPLADYLGRALKGIPNLRVASFHQLCGDVARYAGVEVESSARSQIVYDGSLPNALIQAVTLFPSLKWDTIVVDEGQDFQPTWWSALDSCLKDGGRLRVFTDSNQQLYGRSATYTEGLNTIPIVLSRNLRNTQNIHEAASRHYTGYPVTANGPRGLDVKWLTSDSLEGRFQLAIDELKRLTSAEDVAPGDIAILVNNKTASGLLLDAYRLGNTLTNASDLSSNNVVLDTIKRFKGLERPAVILVVSDGELDQRELAYVAFTRAKAYLCVVCSTQDKEWLERGTEL